MQPMRQAVGLDRMEALEVEQGIDEARDRGIAVIDRHEIGAERVVEGLADQVTGQRRMIETLADAMHHRVFQPLMMQHGGIDEGGKLRLAPNDVFRFLPDAIPDRIERRQLAALRIDLMNGHMLLSQNSLYRRDCNMGRRLLSQARSPRVNIRIVKNSP